MVGIEMDRQSAVTTEELRDVFPQFSKAFDSVLSGVVGAIRPNRVGGRWFTGNPDTALAGFVVWDTFPDLRPEYVGPWETTGGRVARPSFSADWESETLRHCKDFRFKVVHRGDFATLKGRRLNCRLPGKTFEGTTFDNCTMIGAELSGSNLEGSKFVHMSREGREGWANFLNFSGANLRGAEANRTDMRQCRFDGADIDGMSVESARLEDATFWGAVGSLVGKPHFGGDAWLSYTHRSAGEALHAFHERPNSLLKSELEALENARMVEVDDEGRPRLLPFGLRSLRRL